MDPFYVKESDVPETNTRKDFIRRFLNKTSPSSYFDEACTKVQCEKNKFRSITEIHQLTIARFPKTSFGAVVGIIKMLIDEDACVSLVWCTQVRKVVIKYFCKSTQTYMTTYSRDKYLNEKGVDGYSLADYDLMFNELNK